ncbi:hypothetical protein PAECIP111893_00127 [Paenibacillus plantiphilus]|uniref:N-acetyltransferase domain-containing protein n=1 Tax=Paenibacillus plantiphilus TaxID=2905650 RepID=A0ABN8FY57_9BACL|nr:GNAT family N-acetyltransferase [Paenibacillus plantiphilus]CAH1190043.1 hypothetical protein PAECIP111893_00127 [Paenibacillus plantiphilus]
MLQKFEESDSVLNRELFMADEVQYNLIHRICESQSSTCLKSSDETLIYAQSEGNNPWLWISKEAASETKIALLQALLDELDGTSLPGICGEPATAESFAQLYSEVRHTQYHRNMMMEAYYCPKVKKPLDIKGTVQQAKRHHVETVAAFLAGFSEGAYGAAVDPASLIPEAEGMIETGNLYLWIADQLPVSMANISHRSPRHGRINAVYTPSACRKRGYASALAAALCSILESEGFVPMLYADAKNPDSNKVYQNIGFIESGKIVDITFK